jgi:uncharacterized DUF497 family protein
LKRRRCGRIQIGSNFRRPTTEPRFLMVGQIDQAVWTATVTYRHEEATRIISVRRARDDEKARYLDTP